jgi:alpha-tubulin suppressor-like RCC1 family protein
MYSTRNWAGISAVFLFAGAAAYVGCVSDQPSTSPGGGSDAGPDGTTMTDSGGGGDAACGDTTKDANNCGACGHACATGFSCANSVCGNEPTQLAAWGETGLGQGQGGKDTVCALLASGDVYCWGWNELGQLGIPSTTTNTSAPTKVPGIAAAAQVSVGVDHVCALLRDDGSIWCWGDNAYGETGRAPIVEAGAPQVVLPAQVATTSGFKGLSLRGDSSCALDNSGHVTCWGNNDRGSLGHHPGDQGDLSFGAGTCGPDPEDNFCYNPVREAVDAGGVTTLAEYDNGVCTVDPTNDVLCWGDVGFADQGNTVADHFSAGTGPVQIVNGASPLTGVTSIAAGRDTICAIAASPGLGYCWGQNQESQIGNNAPAPGGVGGDRPPTAVPFGGSDASTPFNDVIAFGLGWMHVCALRSDGSVWCAGRDQEGELGVPITSVTGACTLGFPGSACATTPVQVQGVGGTGTLAGATAITAGRGSTCAIVKEGMDSSVYCWGNNSGGELGHAVGASGDLACDGGAGCNYNPFPVKVDGLPH